MKFKLLFITALLFIYASSCNKDEPEVIEPFDHIKQEEKDKEALHTYLDTHYLNDAGELKVIPEGGDQTPIGDSEALQTIIVTHTHKDYDTTGNVIHEQDVAHELHYLMTEEGVNESPTVVDIANVSYKGMLLDHSVFDQNDFGHAFAMDNPGLRLGKLGWVHTIPLFKSGNATQLVDDSYEYSETGKGIILFPSGLGYMDKAFTDIPANSPLIFYIELNDVFRTDHDEDGILSMYEDVNNNGDFKDDDTDGDEVPNYKDADDDGDGTLTIDEDIDGDGDPTNDDTDSDGIPNYLDSDTP